jgi:hypothetical protein
MKMKRLIFIPFIFLTLLIRAQDKISNVEIVGPKTLVLNAKDPDINKSGKLSTGEVIKSGCSHGTCHFQIEYKGRNIMGGIGENISDLTIYEFDFGNDGDKEILVINDFKQTSYLFIYSYGRGLIKKLFEKEIMSYRTAINKDYIELYLPGGQVQVWNFYQGEFWAMTPVEIKE